MLYITYGNGIGPNGVTDGAVWTLNTKTSEWNDITPDKSASRKPGGYFGLSLDRQRPGTLAVATMNHWSPIDTVWRSTDGGATWKDISERSTRDVSLSPYLFWGEKAPKLGWWMSALAIDPFDSDHAAYATGAHTLIAGLSQLVAGEVAVWPTGGPPARARHHNYRPPETGDVPPISLHDLGGALDATIDRLVAKGAGRPIGVPLSGGLDSRFVLAKLVERAYRPLFAFSYGPRGNSDADRR